MAPNWQLLCAVIAKFCLSAWRLYQDGVVTTTGDLKRQLLCTVIFNRHGLWAWGSLHGLIQSSCCLAAAMQSARAWLRARTGSMSSCLAWRRDRLAVAPTCLDGALFCLGTWASPSVEGNSGCWVHTPRRGRLGPSVCSLGAVLEEWPRLSPCLCWRPSSQGWGPSSLLRCANASAEAALERTGQYQGKRLEVVQASRNLRIAGRHSCSW